MVGPTKLQPRFFSSFEISVEVAVFGIAITAARSTSLRPLVRLRLEFPEPGGERAGFVDQLARPPGVVDGRDDLAAMADDAGVLQQPLDILLREAGDALEVETVEGLAEILPLPEDGQPGQSGLETFEADFFEQPMSSATGRPHS